MPSSSPSFCAICYENFTPNNASNHNDNNDDENTSTAAISHECRPPPSENGSSQPPQTTGVVHAILPCCERDQSSVKFCIDCLTALCGRSPLGIGKCPRCNGRIERITTDDEGRVVPRFVIATTPLQCAMCRRFKRPELFHSIGVDNRRRVCTDCQVGMSNTLRYRCRRCHRIQRIPHPMYRYQDSPLEFGTTSWACHVGCGDYTFWRILDEDLEKVPRGDGGIWAEREGWRKYFRERDLEVARREVRGVGRGVGGDDVRGVGVRDRDGDNGWDGNGGICVIQ